MKHTNKMAQLALFISIFFIGYSLVGCGKEELKVTGGELVKYNVIYESNSKLAYELPIITNYKVETLEIDEFVISGKGNCDITYKGMTDVSEYEGYYFSYINLDVGIEKDELVDCNVDSAIMYINGLRIEYPIAKMHFSNVTTQFGKDCDTDRQSIVYTCEKALLYQYIPSYKKENITMEVEEDCTITSIDIVDFVDINNLVVKVNDKRRKIDEGIELKKGDKVSFDFTLNYKGNASSADILKTTFYITYTDKDKNECLFIDEQGLVIINYINDGFVKEYIEKLVQGMEDKTTDSITSVYINDNKQ